MVKKCGHCVRRQKLDKGPCKYHNENGVYRNTTRGTNYTWNKAARDAVK